jgi:two-component system chemotaxis sensor kinase CheA
MESEVMLGGKALSRFRHPHRSNVDGRVGWELATACAARQHEMVDKAVLNEYLSESEQLLDLLLADLEQLASLARPDRSRSEKPAGTPPELINRIFRSVHSLKGLSGMMGMTSVRSLAHEFENVLDDLRLGKLGFDDKVAGLLRESGEWLATLLGAAARDSASDEDFEALRRLLRALAELPRVSRKRSAGLDSIKLSEKERSLLTPYEEHRIIANLEAGRSLYEVKIELRVEELDTSFRSLAEKLGAVGELISSLPGAAAQPDAIGFKLIFATSTKESEIQDLAKTFKAKVEKIGPSLRRRAEAALKSAGRRRKSATRREGTGAASPGRAADSSAEFKPFNGTSDDGRQLPDRLDRDVSIVAGPGGVTQSTEQEFLQPLSAGVRIDLTQIDEISSLAHELNIEAQRLSAMAGRVVQQPDIGARERFDLKQSSRRLERNFLELEERLVELRMVSLAQTFNRAGRLVERLARDLGKKVAVEIAGGGTQVDKMIVDRLSGPIYHVLRNAIDHGMEPAEERLKLSKPPIGNIRLDASLEGTQAIISISDDGRGIDHDRVLRRALEIGAVSPDEELTREQVLRLILRPGFSTATEVSEVSGRGVGLDAVERAIYELAGEIRISSEPGKGTRFELSVPTTLMMISAFIVGAAEYRYAINVGHIVELLYMSPSNIVGPDGKRRIEWRGSAIPLIELKYLLGLGGARRLGTAEKRTGDRFGRGRIGLLKRGDENGAIAPNTGGGGSTNRIPALITRVTDRTVAIAVERFDSQREIIVKSLGGFGRKLKGVVGAVDLEGGDVALVLDLAGLLMLRSIRV